MEKIEGEVWMEYPDYEGYYLISNLGRVASYFINKKCKSESETIVIKSPIGKHYRHNTLCKNGKQRTRVVHHAVAKCFVKNPKPDEYRVINHIDGNKLNNHYTNLEWCTPKMNSKHAFDTGLMTIKKGEECSYSKFTSFTISRIKVFIKLNFKLEIFLKYSVAMKVKFHK